MSELEPMLGPPKRAKAPTVRVADPSRVCPNCKTPERRWLEDGRERVNLDPFTGNCVNCLRELAKETRATLAAQAAKEVVLPFDARAAAANDRSEP